MKGQIKDGIVEEWARNFSKDIRFELNSKRESYTEL